MPIHISQVSTPYLSLNTSVTSIMQSTMQISHQMAAQKLSSKHAVAAGLALPKSIATRQRLAVQTRAAKNPFKAPFKAKVCLECDHVEWSRGRSCIQNLSGFVLRMLHTP